MGSLSTSFCVLGSNTTSSCALEIQNLDRYKGQPIVLLSDSTFPPFQKARLLKDIKRKIREEQNVALPRGDVIIYTHVA